MTFESCVVGSCELLVRTNSLYLVLSVFACLYLCTCCVYCNGKSQKYVERMTFKSCVVGSCELVVRTMNVFIGVVVYMQMCRCVSVFVQCVLSTED